MATNSTFRLGGSGSSNKIVIDTTQQTFSVSGTSSTTQTLYTKVIPANALETNNSIRFKLIYPRVTFGTGSSSLSFSATYGGQTIFSSAICISVGGGNITDKGAIFDAYITANGSTNSQKNNIDYFLHQTSPSNLITDYDTKLTTTTVNSTVSQNLVITATIQSSSANGTFTCEGLIVELIS